MERHGLDLLETGTCLAQLVRLQAAFCTRDAVLTSNVISEIVPQGVHEIYDVVEGPEWRPGEPCSSKLVFIGRRLRRDALAAGLKACLAQQDS